MSTLEDAIAIAVRAHKGQKDKAGASYILHPLRVMLKMDTEIAMIVAVLHDVVEDTAYTLVDLHAQGFPEAVVSAVESLTRLPEESYEEFIDRVKLNPIARKVKLADLEDNMNLERLENVTEHDQLRQKRYAQAFQKLTTLAVA